MKVIVDKIKDEALSKSDLKFSTKFGKCGRLINLINELIENLLLY